MPQRSPMQVFITFCLAFLCFIPHGQALTLAISDEDSPVKPPSDNTLVRVGIDIMDISSISGYSDFFQITAYLHLTWNDPRVAFAPEHPDEKKHFWGEKNFNRAISSMWIPRITFRGVSMQRSVLDTMLTVSGDGQVIYGETFQSEFPTKLDLRKFPFDRQYLSFFVTPHMGETSIQLVLDAKHLRWSPTVNLRGWHIDGLKELMEEYTMPWLKEKVQTVEIRLEISRIGAFYV